MDLFFPKYCLNCQKQGKFICSQCLESIPILNKNHQTDNLTKLIITADYNNPLVKQLIHSFKYEFVKELAQPLGQLMIKRLDFKDNSVLIPVPLHQKRIRWRGFNQSELLAQQISQQLSIPLLNILSRKRNIKPQAIILNSLERKENIKNAFVLKENISLKDKTVILIDDVSTTGATLQECAKTLKQLEPEEIWGLVLARG